MRLNLIISLFIFSFPGFLFSQSMFLEEGVGGSGFSADTCIEISQTETSWSTAGTSISYSIGGIMDVGVKVGYEAGTLNDWAYTNWNLDLLYNVIVLKQSLYNPLSIQLSGSYGYTNFNSGYYDYFKVSKTGQGLFLDISVFHEFFKDEIFSFILGGIISYSNYLYTTYDVSDPAVPLIDSSDKEETLGYGGSGYISFKPVYGPILSAGATVKFNYTENFYEIIPSLIFIVPAF